MDRYFSHVDPYARRRLNNRKWREYGADVIPAWIAEHDYRPPDAITSALAATVAEADFGYHGRDIEVAEAFAGWSKRRYGHQPDPLLTHTCVDALAGVTAAVTALAAPGEAVILTPPIYDVFWRICPESHRAQQNCALRRGADLRWHFDADDLRAHLEAAHARSARGERVPGQGPPKVLLWCNPHNPTGWVPDPATMTRVVELAHEFDFHIVSDEIHADMVFAPQRFTPMAAIPGAASRVVTVTSPAKTFAMSGLRCAVISFGDEALAERVMAAHPPLLLGHASRTGADAAVAAWTEPEAEQWADELVVRLAALRDHLAARLAEEAPQVRFRRPDSTFLAWLDLSECGLGDSPSKALLKRARMALKEGTAFGPEGAGHVRLNYGTTTKVLDTLIDRMVSAVSGSSGPT